MRRVALVLAVLVGVLFMINRQWLRENTLVNAPVFDALVYQNQSYDDYLLIRKSGLWAIYQKYTDGRWHVPPLHMLSGTFLYLLLGRDSANFYIAPAFWLYLMLLGVYGFVHYWTGRAAWAILGAGLVVTVHSAIGIGLRLSQTDFSVGAAYTWALYLLVASDGLRSWRPGLLYGFSVGICVLLKSSIAPYLLAHALIWLLYMVVEREHRLQRLLNALLAAGVVLLLTAWFFLANYGQIIAYYTKWGAELSQVTRAYAGINSTTDEVLFYLRSFMTYHMGSRNLSPYFWTTALAIGSGLAAVAVSVVRGRLGRAEPRPEAQSDSRPAFRTGYPTCCSGPGSDLGAEKEDTRRIWFGVAVAGIWLAVPYAILTAYASKAFSVDFPFLATFFVIPILLAAIAFRGRLMAIGLLLFLPLLAVQARDQTLELFQSQPMQLWREQEVMGDIFRDAEARGLRDVGVSNAFVHGHLTSENLRFFVVNGTFWQWQDRFKLLSLHFYSDPRLYYEFLLGADYILAKTADYQPTEHPNNLVAPDVNRLLAASPVLSLLKRYDLPDGSQLLVYRNDVRTWITYPEPASDRWISQRFPITLYGPIQDRSVQVNGRIFLPSQLSYPVQLFLEDEGGTRVTEPISVPNNDPFALQLQVPAATLSTGGGRTTLYLVSDRSFRPVDYGISADARRLLLVLTTLADAKP